VWPTLLYQRFPALFTTWLWDNNFDRFLGIHHHGEEHPNRLRDLLNLLQLSMPTGALTILMFWQRRRFGFVGVAETVPALIVLSAYGVSLIVTLEVSASLREVYFLPLYPALALLAAGVRWPERWSDRLARLTILVSLFLAALVVTAWLLLLTGNGGWMRPLDRWLPLDYAAPFDLRVLCAVLVLLALCAAFAKVFDDGTPVPKGFAGVALVWGLVNSLLLPWLDQAKTYRHTFNQLAQALPRDTHCVHTLGLGESERAMLQYFTGVVPYELQGHQSGTRCEVTLLMLKPGRAAPEWLHRSQRAFWRGSRAGEFERPFIAYIAPSQTFSSSSSVSAGKISN
jgi:4-amino-4-deoxy-L-arabinose transferase-like glycosyltransferase